MGFFGGKKSYLGVDIGTSSIKVLEAHSEGGTPKLLTYGFVEQATDLVKSDAAETQGRIITALKEIIRTSHMTSNKVVASLPTFTVFSSIISLPVMSKKDLFAAVRWEAKKFVPIPLDDMVLDWRLLKEDVGLPTPAPGSGFGMPKGPKTMRVLLTAAPRNLVSRYRDIFRAADLEIVAIETEAFALERSLVGNDPAPMMVVDVGALATSISILVDGIPFINRSIDVGGETVTKAIAHSMNIDEARAEQFKRDVGIVQSREGTSQVAKTIEFVISAMVNEIRYVLNFYRSQSSRSVEKIILAGGSAFLPNFPGYLEGVTGFKVVIGDPWSRLATPFELKPVLEEIGPRFAVAIGLALREIL